MLNELIVGGERFLLTDILLNIAIAFVLGAAVAIVYRRTHSTFNYSTSFVNTLVILPMITAVVMMVIGNNLARAFGLVGAMSIIRFRTAVKDTRDITFVFLTLAAGMAAGTGYHVIALAGTGMIVALIAVLYASHVGTTHGDDLLLRFMLVPDERGGMFHEKTFKKYLKKNTLLNIQTRRDGELLELTYFVRLKAPENTREFVTALGGIDGVEGVSLISMDETAEA
jgi:uncharacterized membrane protein YhiD involved in acid resistance